VADHEYLLLDTASPNDSYELAFTKGEVLEILDNSGKWWEAIKADGTKGSEHTSTFKLDTLIDINTLYSRPLQLPQDDVISASRLSLDLISFSVPFLFMAYLNLTYRLGRPLKLMLVFFLQFDLLIS
jgi:hypothetical protein